MSINEEIKNNVKNDQDVEPNNESGNVTNEEPVSMEKPKRNVGDMLPLVYLKTFLLIYLGQFVGAIIVNIPTLILSAVAPDVATSAAWQTGASYFSNIGIWIVTLLCLFIFKKNRYILDCVGKKANGNNLIQLAIGLALGFGMNAFCILIAWLNNDISFSFHSFEPFSFIIIFITVFIQSSAEELVCRGYMYQKLRNKYKKPIVAILGNSLFFAILHLFNPGITILSFLNILLVGILFSIIVYYRSLWCAFALHAAWNFSQSIIFGLPNSGLVFPYSVFKLDAKKTVNSLAYHQEFGIEGSLTACIVILLVCVALYFWYNKRAKINS